MTSEDSVTIVVPEPHYSLLQGTRDDLPAVIVVNDALLSFEFKDIFAWHLEVTLHAVDLADQGMPSPQESELLFQIGDQIEQVIEGYNALFLARSTWNGLRQIAFRVYDASVANDALQSLIAHDQERFWEFRMEHDPSWEQATLYLDLLPQQSGLTLS